MPYLLHCINSSSASKKTPKFKGAKIIS